MKRQIASLFLCLVLGSLVPGCRPTPIRVTVLPTPDEVTLVRGPYLQSVTATSVIVAWETGAPSRGTVAYGPTPQLEQRAAAPDIAARHAVTLTGLSPYTFYHYQVQGDGVPLGDQFTFRTAAGPDQDRFSFVVFGDTRTQHASHRAVVDLVTGLEPDLALHTGDLVAHGGVESEWRLFFEIESALMARVPLFPTLGNHEANSPLYYDLFYLPGNERWYSFDYGHAHFVCLAVDNLADLSAEGSQMAWLRADLAGTDRPWKFAFLHVPPHSSLHRSTDDPRGARVVAPILVEHGVQVVFSGHDHNYQRLVVDGVTWVITAGGGAPLYSLGQPHPGLVAHAVQYHAVQVTLDGAELVATAISLEHEELDRFTLRLPESP
jgi:hypothetical protein